MTIRAIDRDAAIRRDLKRGHDPVKVACRYTVAWGVVARILEEISAGSPPAACGQSQQTKPPSQDTVAGAGVDPTVRKGDEAAPNSELPPESQPAVGAALEGPRAGVSSPQLPASSQAAPALSPEDR